MTMVQSNIKRVTKSVLARAGYEIRSLNPRAADNLPGEAQWVKDIIAKVQPFTLTGAEKIAALCHAVEYIARCKVPGDIVECGVWKGGSVMAAALTLLRGGEDLRSLHLFDTFEGMSAPTENDTAVDSGVTAADLLANARDRSDGVPWVYVPIETVRQNLRLTGYPMERFRLVKGKVEITLPEHAPNEIALLRLDTDWYESTRHELAHLYPRLVAGGVLIIDDYGCWEGSRKATDEYIKQNDLPLLLNRIEPTGRIAVKP